MVTDAHIEPGLFFKFTNQALTRALAKLQATPGNFVK